MKDDLISRQDAIERATKEHDFYKGATIPTDKARRDELLNVMCWLGELPSAQPEPQWIPCSERLPEEDVEVLISYRYKEGEGDTSHVNVDITSYGQMYFGGREVAGEKHWRQPFEYFSSNYEVIAWMPLPEPWKGEER